MGAAVHNSKHTCFLTKLPQFQFPMFKNFFRGKITNVAEVNQQIYSEESGQWLKNVD